jgi:lipoate-protein ligase A
MSNYSHATWRLLITYDDHPLSPRERGEGSWVDGATNMAIDEAILQSLAQGQGQPTLRFYQWQPACLSLGYNQAWSEVNEAACWAHGYTWTRRATGGKAIFHTDELTYSLIMPEDDPRIVGGILRSYQVLSLGLLRGLQKLGVEAEQAEKREQPRTKADRQGPVCFDTPGRYEIVWRGKKLVGSAQLRRKKVVLQHGTLPLHGDLKRILELLNLSPEEREQQELLLPQRATTLEMAIGRVCSFEEIATALAQGMAEELNLTLETSPLTDHELNLAAELRANQYDHETWNKRV